MVTHTKQSRQRRRSHKQRKHWTKPRELENKEARERSFPRSAAARDALAIRIGRCRATADNPRLTAFYQQPIVGFIAGVTRRAQAGTCLVSVLSTGPPLSKRLQQHDDSRLAASFASLERLDRSVNVRGPCWICWIQFRGGKGTPPPRLVGTCCRRGTARHDNPYNSESADQMMVTATSEKRQTICSS